MRIHHAICQPYIAKMQSATMCTKYHRCHLRKQVYIHSILQLKHYLPKAGSLQKSNLMSEKNQQQMRKTTFCHDGCWVKGSVWYNPCLHEGMCLKPGIGPGSIEVIDTHYIK